jgi:hypothetical protein
MTVRFTHMRPERIAAGLYQHHDKARVRKRGAAMHREQERTRCRLNLYLDGVTMAQIRAIAVYQEASLSTVIRELVLDALTQRTAGVAG